MTIPRRAIAYVDVHVAGEPGRVLVGSHLLARGETMAEKFDYARNHLDWLRHAANLLLVVGQGAWETHPTGALPSTLALAALLAEKGIPHELDVWGFDVPHDWPSWRNQIRHHLPRFC